MELLVELLTPEWVVIRDAEKSSSSGSSIRFRVDAGVAVMGDDEILFVVAIGNSFEPRPVLSSAICIS